MPTINLGKVRPVIKGEWIQTNAYEVLDVTSYQGISYIATQDVPRNTHITAEDYWSPLIDRDVILDRDNHTGTQSADTIRDPENFELNGGSLGDLISIANSDNQEFTVGEGGDFANINDALNHCYNIKTKLINEGSPVTVRLLSGYRITEQVAIHYFDMSFIRITSDDEVVMVDTQGMTAKYQAAFNYNYIFLFTDNAKSPIIDILMDHDKNDNSIGVVAYYVTRGARLTFAERSGGTNFWKGVHASHSAHVNLLSTMTSTKPDRSANYGVDLSGASRRCVDAYHSCEINLPFSFFENCTGDYGVFMIWNSSGDMKFSSAQNSSGKGFAIRDGGHACWRDCNAQNCDYGFYVIHGARADVRSHGGTLTGETDEEDPNTSIWFENAQNCRIGIHIHGGCHVEAVNMNLRNCNIGIRAINACTINSYSSNFDGCDTAVFGRSSLIDINGSQLTNITGTFVYLEENASCNANGVTMSGGSSYCVEIDRQCNLNLNSAKQSGPITGVMRASSMSSINLAYCNLPDTWGSQVRRHSDICFREGTFGVPDTERNHINLYHGSKATWTSNSVESGGSFRCNVQSVTWDVNGTLYQY